MNWACNSKFFLPGPRGGVNGQIPFNFNYKVNFKDYYAILCVCTKNEKYKTYQKFFFLLPGSCPRGGTLGCLGAWLDLILSLFFYCCRCPRYWGRQQVARVSNTQSPRLFVQWIYAAKVAHFHISHNTFRPGLFRSPSSSGTRNRHTCDGVYAWGGVCNMSIPSQTPSAESCCHLLHS